MPLIKCPECGKMISEYANACPNCGCPKDAFSKLKSENGASILVSKESLDTREDNFSNGKKDIHKGDLFEFGNYFRENGQSEKIQWIVIKELDGKKLLITKDVIAAKTYNSFGSATDWIHSSLRKWLNSEFLSDAFSEEESNEIVLGNDGDKIFLLDSNEIRLLMTKEERVCTATNYAKGQGATVGLLRPCSCYWLKSDNPTDFAPMVFGGGSITGDPMSDGVTLRGGKYVGDVEGVRPSLWIS